LTTSAHAFSVFACEPEWAALTKALFPEAEVVSATTAQQDPHHIEARPSLIAQLRRADLAVCTGASLEAGWLPMLQARAGNAKVQNDQPGMFYAAEFVTLIDPHRGAITPFSGDVHPEGNPHMHADPRRVLQVARALADRLMQLNPKAAPTIAARHAEFHASFSQKIAQWERTALPLKGRAVVTQHASLGYLWQWLQLKPVADLEPKPGMPPTPGHLERLRTQLNQSPASAIIIAQHHDKRAAQWLAQQDIGKTLPLIILPATVTEISPEALAAWFDSIITTLTTQIK
jgi:zinc/manganese transport system substrate-binding protein